MKLRIYADVKVKINTEDIHKKDVIYRFTFPNGKFYIGQTTQELNSRVKSHCYSSFNINEPDFKYAKGRAIRKYMQFEVDILYQGENLDEEEIKFIEMHNSMDKEYGYNLNIGGGGNKGHIVSEETRKKMSEAQKGKIISEETRKKISEANKGKVSSKETRKKLSEASNHKKKKTYMYNLDGEFIQEFESISEAARKTGLAKSNIQDNLNGTTKAVKEYYFTNVKVDNPNVEKGKRKKVLQYDLEGNFIREYKSTVEAIQLNEGCSKISAVCRGERKTAGGFIWKYKN